jgi:Uncharacterized conserved protein
MTGERKLATTVLSCLFTALMTVGAYIALPLPGTPVPIVFQNFFIMLAALLIGPRWGLAAVLTYLCLGAIGLPVFAGGAGGLARFIGPTGGYLIGYVPAVLVIGIISDLGARRRLWRDGLAAIMGCAIVDICGIVWLKAATSGSWEASLAAGLLPFLPGDAVKIILATLISGRLAPIVERARPRKRSSNHGTSLDA